MLVTAFRADNCLNELGAGRPPPPNGLSRYCECEGLGWDGVARAPRSPVLPPSTVMTLRGPWLSIAGLRAKL